MSSRKKKGFAWALYQGITDAFITLQHILMITGIGLKWSWRYACHVLVFGSEPGDIVFQDNPAQAALYNKMIERGARRHLAIYKSTSPTSNPTRTFVLSNRFFNDRIQPDQEELETIAAMLETRELKIETLLWDGRVMTPYMVGALGLMRHPDDVVMPPARRWLSQPAQS